MGVSMSRRKVTPLSQREVPAAVRERLRPPLAVVLGSPAEVVHLLAALPPLEAFGHKPEAPAKGAVCYQMDLHQAERVTAELGEANLAGKAVTLPDLWDLPADFQTAVYMAARGGERELKIDMVEQAFHVLRPAGTLVVWSSYETDPFFPALLKKVFGRVHERREGPDTVFWCVRQGDRPRRRHEVTFQARVAGGEPCRFVSRPGVFSYGRFDDGARALAEVMEIHPGDRVLDVGCGCGTNGVFAAQLAGPDGFVTFVDSNVRATALAELNARNNAVARFQAVASSRVEGPEENSFDVALANPPYFANSSIARLFIDRARELLKRDGRFYLVTRQPDEVAEPVAETFGRAEALLRRGYTILCA
jgi:16S rRNA (guanine1207-N2)-methyltransferase